MENRARQDHRVPVDETLPFPEALLTLGAT